MALLVFPQRIFLAFHRFLVHGDTLLHAPGGGYMMSAAVPQTQQHETKQQTTTTTQNWQQGEVLKSVLILRLKWASRVPQIEWCSCWRTTSKNLVGRQLTQNLNF